MAIYHIRSKGEQSFLMDCLCRRQQDFYKNYTPEFRNLRLASHCTISAISDERCATVGKIGHSSSKTVVVHLTVRQEQWRKIEPSWNQRQAATFIKQCQKFGGTVSEYVCLQLLLWSLSSFDSLLHEQQLEVDTRQWCKETVFWTWNTLGLTAVIATIQRMSNCTV